MSLDITLSSLLLFCRIAIGFAFLISSVGKASNLQQFRQTIAAFNILPHEYTDSMAVSLICIEAMVTFCMVVGNRILALGFVLAILLLLLFSIALLSVLARKIAVSCHCFGSNDKLVTGFDVIRNGGFIFCALAATWILFGAKQTDSSLSIAEGIMVGLSATVFVLIWIKLGDIMQILSQNS